MEKAQEWHKTLVEAAAEHDESLMEKFFESESLTEDEMREGIRKGLAARGMFPVFCVCAGKDMGVRRLMEFLGNVVPVVDEMPDMFNLVLNSDHRLIKQVLSDAETACAEKLVPVESEIAMLTLRRNELQKAQEGKKDEEIPTAEKDELSDVEKKIEAQKTEKENILNGYAAGNKVVHQLIDLALLQNNMLKGEALTNFVKRSVEMI